MNSTQIEQYLGFLGEKLAEMQVKTSLILLGGALMVTQFGNRKATQDIDVVIATNDCRTYQAVLQAVGLVAKEKKLPPAWLNDDVTVVVDQIGKPQTPKYRQRAHRCPNGPRSAPPFLAPRRTDRWRPNSVFGRWDRRANDAQ